MKRLLPALLWFLFGALTASVVWGWKSFKFQTELSVINLTLLHGQATLGEQVHLEDPKPESARRLELASSNMITGFGTSLHYWDQEYPWLRAGARYGVEEQRLRGFLDTYRERNQRLGEPDGAANGSQPIRSETNPPSSAAGSRR